MKPTALALRRPTFLEVTAAAVLATGLWIAVVGLARTLGLALAPGDAGALLVVVAWGCLAVRLGLDLARGGRHLAVYLAVSAVLLGAYEAVRWLLA